MNPTFKPACYNSVSSYFVVEDAPKFINMLKDIFDAKELRRYDLPDGSIMHAEMLVDDSVIMVGNASAQYPPNQMLLHIYVKDVDYTFEKAINLGCQLVEKPKEGEGDPDRRGTFKDYFGNIWAIGTQKKQE